MSNKDIPLVMPEASEGQLGEEGQKAGFETLKTASDNAAKTDSEAISKIAEMTSDFIDFAKDNASKAETEEERAAFFEQVQEELRRSRDSISEINERSHNSQRGISTLAATSMLLLAGVAISGATWLLSKSK